MKKREKMKVIAALISYLFISKYESRISHNFNWFGLASESLESYKADKGAILAPFADISLSSTTLCILQDWLRSDILRRSKELMALAWLGRIYVTTPIIFNVFFPSLFQFKLYNNQSLLTTPLPHLSDGHFMVDCTLKESSIISRGIPIRLRFFMHNNEIKSVKLLAVGCDVKSNMKTDMNANEKINMKTETRTDMNTDQKDRDKQTTAISTSSSMNSTFTTIFSESINKNMNKNIKNKKIIVNAITSTIFKNIPTVMSMAKSGVVDLEAIGPIQEFFPEKDLFALEGTTEKWLQEVFKT